jgi:hypothetical protein
MKNNIRDWSNMKEEKKNEKKYINDANEITFVDTISLLTAAYAIIESSEKTVQSFLKTDRPMHKEHKEKLIEIIKEMLQSWLILYPEKEFPTGIGEKIMKDLGYEINL